MGGEGGGRGRGVNPPVPEDSFHTHHVLWDARLREVGLVLRQGGRDQQLVLP